ncbi:MAG: PHP domain-containing protein [Candidatus Omnitrophota bacterium]
MKYADLHVHTDFSDGTFSPEEVVDTAKEKKLSCIAICDHDCIDAIGPSIKHARGTQLEIIPGVELTVIKDGREIHVLGYFISWKERWFQEVLRKVQRGRIERLDKMLEKLEKFDIKLKKDRVIEIAGGKGSVGRLHLARALLEAKAVSSIQMAFNKYIGDFRPCYVEDVGFGAKEALEVILRAKGVPVLAHPRTINDDSLVQELIKLGLRGIEAYHTDHQSQDSKKYEKMARDYGLIVTGGSDCHGMGKGRVLLGSVKVPYSVVEQLKQEAERIRENGKIS